MIYFRNSLTGKILVFFWIVFLFAGIGYIFWKEDVKYSLPTPVPENYQNVERGTMINLSPDFPLADHHKPLLIHFFNPECPCSRFNIPHFKTLVRKYKNEMDFAVVVMNDKISIEETKEKFGIDVPVVHDNLLAKKCGVYSTPQAVILTGSSQLFYKGNYNKTRYCTDPQSNYAQMAIDSLLNKNLNLTFAKEAFTAYGCVLPVCSK